MTSTTDTAFNLISNEKNHYTFLPIYNAWYYEHYKRQVATFWTVEEVDLSKDRDQFQTKLSEPERNFVKNILAFFAASDGIVAENLDLNFIDEISYKEVRSCLRFQAMMEDIHSEMYSRLIETYIDDNNEKHRLFNAIINIPCISLKAEWAKKWTNSKDASLAKRLVAWACVEGIHFSGSFCAIYWLKKRNLMSGLTQSNELIARDESSHTQTSIQLYKDLKKEEKLADSVVREIVEEAVTIETVFITESISCAMLGMNVDMMKQYIKYVADQLMIQLEYNKIYNVTNPFDFMENISVETKTNFFEHKVTAYNKACVGDKEEDKAFDLDADF
jgi:ribonucleotide reductase beta subunit family protein with ferritin-like domain